jgi:hypothetical protein
LPLRQFQVSSSSSLLDGMFGDARQNVGDIGHEGVRQVPDGGRRCAARASSGITGFKG